MAGKRGRQRQSVDTIRTAYHKFQNKMQISDALRLVVDKSSGRVGVFTELEGGDLDALIAGVSGNTFVDALKIASILCKYSDGNFLREDSEVEKVDLSDTEA